MSSDPSSIYQLSLVKYTINNISKLVGVHVVEEDLHLVGFIVDEEDVNLVGDMKLWLRMISML